MTRIVMIPEEEGEEQRKKEGREGVK